MQFTVLREQFLKPLKAVAGVVERRHHLLPILSHVLIEVFEDYFKLTTTDQEVELISKGKPEKVLECGRITVPFRKLMDLCRALPESGVLQFTKTGERVVIRAEKSRFTLSCLPAEEFPNLEINEGDNQITVAKKTLRHLVDKTSFAMAEQDVRYYLNGMLLEINDNLLTAVASDGHRLALNRTDFNQNSHETNSETNSDIQKIIEISGKKSGKLLRIIIPRKGVLELLRILDEEDEHISLVVSHNHMRAITENVTLTSKLLEGRFPDYDRIIPSQGDKIVQGKREVLKEAFLRAQALFSDKFRGVRLHLSPGRLKILATNTEQDEVEEDLEVQYQGGELEVGFNVKYLIDFLNVIETEVVQFSFSDAQSSTRVEGVGEEGVYVIMPMRI